MMDYSIETANWRDLNSVRKIEQECFPLDAWPLLDVVAVLTFPDTVRLKAVSRGSLVGFAAGDIRRSEAMAWITTICVAPAFRRQGIATALLAACEEQMKIPRVRLCVRRSNTEAIQLYAHLGYTQVSVWAGYYHDGEDALVLEKIAEI
jgi:ribosomal-protein-alanine N-acetyltransferase